MNINFVLVIIFHKKMLTILVRIVLRFQSCAPGAITFANPQLLTEDQIPLFKHHLPWTTVL